MGAGILLTRLLGFVRERLFAHYFGDGATADAFRAALRIPNVIRNLLGEGTLSASFIPVYASMLGRGETEAARRLAGVIASLLVLLAAVAALTGIVLAPVITDFAAPGFTGPTRELTIRLVEIMFPMSGILILSAWCLGVLNTHRRFFLSYAAPSLWNIAQIATLVTLGGLLLETPLGVALAWGALAGSALQVVVQLPAVLKRAGRFRWGLSLQTAGVRPVVRAWIPVVVGAGVYQISSIIDTQLASLLAPGAVAILGYAQLVAILPVSLFGVSVAAVALPELARDAADSADAAVTAVAADRAGGRAELVRERLADATQRLAFFVLPSAVAFATLASPIIATLFQTGAFGAAETATAAGVLAAYAIAIPAQATVKLFASGHYALGDTRTPVRIAGVSVALSAGSAYLLMQRFGPAGIALGAAVGGYFNTTLNYGRLSARLGGFVGSPERRALFASIAAALPAALVGWGTVRLLADLPTWFGTGAALVGFAAVYGAVSLGLGHPEARRLWAAVRRR